MVPWSVLSVNCYTAKSPTLDERLSKSAFAFRAKAGPHLPTPKGWKAELA